MSPTNEHEERPLLFYWLALIVVAAGSWKEISVGSGDGSPVNWSGGIHMAIDGLGIAMMIGVHWWAPKIGHEKEHEFRLGWARISLVLIVAAIAWIAWEAVTGLASPHHVAARPMVIASASDLVANIAQYLLIGSCMCGTDRTGRLHAILDIFAASAGVAGSLATAATGIDAINPFAALIVAMIMSVVALLTWFDLKDEKP